MNSIFFEINQHYLTKCTEWTATLPVFCTFPSNCTVEFFLLRMKACYNGDAQHQCCNEHDLQQTNIKDAVRELDWYSVHQYSCEAAHTGSTSPYAKISITSMFTSCDCLVNIKQDDNLGGSLNKAVNWALKQFPAWSSAPEAAGELAQCQLSVP